MLWVSRSQRKTLIQDGGTKSYFSNLLLKLFDVWTDLSHFSPWKCCFYNGYTSCKYYSIHFAVFLCKKVAFITILTTSLKNHRNRPKLAIFFIFFSRLEHGKSTNPLSKCFLQLTNIRGIPVAQQTFVSWWNSILHFKQPQIIFILQFRSLQLHTNMRLLSGKWWPKPQITNMTWLLYHLACHWRKRNQIQSYKFVLESARFIQTSHRI